MVAPPPAPPPKPGSLPPPKGLAAKLTSVEDEPDDPTRLMDRRPPPAAVPVAASSQRAFDRAAFFNAPTKILPRVRSGGVLRAIGANLLGYTQRPSVNLALLLLAGTLLVGLGFVLGTARKEPREPAAPEPPAADKAAIHAPVARTTPVMGTASAPVAAIAVSSLPPAPPRDMGGAVRASSGSSSARAPSTDFPLPPDRPPATVEKGFVPPVRNPGF